MLKQLLGITAIASVFASASPLEERQTVQGVQNALGIGKDPSAFSQVVSGTRQYYFPNIAVPAANGRNLVTLQISNDLNTVLSDQANDYTIWNTTYTPNDTGFYKYGTNNYIITVAINPQSSGIRVLQNTGTDLTKGWKELGQIKDENGKVLVGYDSQAFDVNGKKYLLYGYSGHSIYIAQLTSETTVANAALIVSTTGNPPVQEAPGALVQGDTVNIFWSENMYQTPFYNVRRLSTSTSSNLVSRSTWSGLPITTILQNSTTNGVQGPGSASTFTGPDGKPWLAYDCYYSKDGSFVGPRKVQVQPITFTGNGNVMASMVPLKPTRFNT
ncbi:glycoside hydrolase family 43 protein [Zasmidium cellare ATCC 36951]|uniref:Glycoside hydrolase family 43 protein n=1 Tax=Zasmidium cellare ATCC 36951 TaxID=1080233 RepID=A0A6A6CE68_ZASCE|nr:glycoside hydrolase family 43 protein [Zasmidium cellare ATCC 36951]KAF2164530.1 glycoside hydrolase family 43 protein [Zasmidium cellare ATCC 36951]